MSSSSNNQKQLNATDEDVKSAQNVFEQFLLNSPFVNGSNNDGGMRLKNTFIEVEESDNFVGSLGYRSSTAPADISEEIFQLARTITRDLPLMATIVEGLEAGNFDLGSSSPSTSAQNNSQSFVVTPTVAAPTVMPEDADMTVETNFTTVMLRNIPNKYTQSTLLQALDARSFRGFYNFFYLPVDYKNHCNMGYAFINFVDHNAAIKFMKAFEGFQLPAKSSKVCTVCWARVQGINANVAHYRNSPVNDLPDPSYRPLLFQNGVEVAFPRPDSATKRSSARRRHSPSDSSGNVPYTRTTSQTSVTPAGFADSNAAVKLFIGGLNAETRDGDIRHHFEKFGPVLDASVVIDKKTGLSRGFGFCSFVDPAAGERVMAQRQHVISGQSVGVRFYQQGRK
jgi:hypothetical protein